MNAVERMEANGFERDMHGMWFRTDDVFEVRVTDEDGALLVGVYNTEDGDTDAGLMFEVDHETTEVLTTGDDRPLTDETVVMVHDMVFGAPTPQATCAWCGAVTHPEGTDPC